MNVATLVRLCHSSYLLADQCGGPDLVWGQSFWVSWWTKWYSTDFP